VFICSVEDVNIDITTRLNRQLNRLVEDLGFEKGSFDMIVSSPPDPASSMRSARLLQFFSY
jgi:type I restriction-modification system DNA methylase subunit